MIDYIQAHPSPPPLHWHTAASRPAHPHVTRPVSGSTPRRQQHKHRMAVSAATPSARTSHYPRHVRATRPARPSGPPTLVTSSAMRSVRDCYGQRLKCLPMANIKGFDVARITTQVIAMRHNSLQVPRQPARCCGQSRRVPISPVRATGLTDPTYVRQ